MLTPLQTGLGAEAVSLAISHSSATSFRAAGYAPIATNATYTGGLVRQHGNLSFTRVFQAGHEVPSYQPETAYAIFRRAIFGQDIATGTIDTNANPDYSTEGSNDTLSTRQTAPERPYPHQCYVLAQGATCTEAQIESLENGTALVENYILIDGNQTSAFPGVGSLNGTVPGGGSPSGGTSGGETGGEGPNNSSAGTGASPPTTGFTGAAAERLGVGRWTGMLMALGVGVVAVCSL